MELEFSAYSLNSKVANSANGTSPGLAATMSRKSVDLESQTHFVRVPAGPFIYGPEVTYERLEKAPLRRPRQEITLAEFWIARYPVTYAEWKTFLDETGYPWPWQWYTIRRGWRGWLHRFVICDDYPAEMTRYPMVDVSLADALAYCEWLSDKTGLPCTLPTEFQWEKAARGPDGRTYPWGEALPRPELARLRPTHTLGPDYYFYNLFTRPQSELAHCGWYWRVGTPLPVGAIPQNVSPYGCYDLAGNVWEWTTSLYNENLPDFHVVKGGSWGYSPQHTACNCRSACSIMVPSVEYHAQGTGFRVLINT
jgi:formylglycine-generating enzyme required for sulfatase activity